MTITQPHSDRILQLRRLWQQVFGDTDAFLNKFFSLAYSRERCLCAMEGDILTGMLYWLPCGKYAYLYAVATHPKYRGRGICRRLMEAAHRAIAAQGYEGVLLYPQDEGLRAMYRKMGYIHQTRIREFHCTAGEAPTPLVKISAAEYFDLRKPLLPPCSAVQESPFREMMDGLCFYRGDGLLLAADPQSQPLMAAEILGSTHKAPGILKFLEKDAGSFRCPGDEMPFAMFCPLRENAAAPSYFAFPLD